MLYKSYLRKLNKCPFCDLKKEEIIKENKDVVLILAKAPYTTGHLLVVPKKHVLRLKSLTKKRKDNIEKIIYYAMEKLYKKYGSVNILFRQGNKKEIGKSIAHIHYHLIPKIKIGAYNINVNKRRIYSYKEYLTKTKEIKRKFKL